MKDGEIAEQGTYEELMKAGKAFAKLIEEYGEAEEEKEEEEIDVKSADKKEIEKEKENNKAVSSSKALMTTEERSTGSVDNKIYFAYLRAGGGYVLLPLLIFLLIMMQGTNIGCVLLS